MKRLTSLSLFFWLTLVAVAQSLLEKHARLLTPPRQYVCHRTAGKINVDGKLNEPSWQMAENTAPFVDISGTDFPTPKYETKVKMLWDDRYFYVAAVLCEEDIRAKLKQRDTIIYYDNDFEVFVDPDGDAHNYFELEVNARGTLFDLMLDKPYRNNGNFVISWDCPGLKIQVHRDGTLNKSSDTDKAWTVEMAIPHDALTVNFSRPPLAGHHWRVNFSRVQWLSPGQKEENWVWTPTGKIDMHMPDRWGYVFFSDQRVGTKHEALSLPYDTAVYRTLWALYYEQEANRAKKGTYLRTLSDFMLAPADTANLPDGAKIEVDASGQAFVIAISVPTDSCVYRVDHEGKFRKEAQRPRQVKNWVWTRIDNKKTDDAYRRWFVQLKACGIAAVLFESYDERVYRLCKEAGLEAHHWRWTMNRAELMTTQPDWYAVNKKGESSWDKPAYVDYYRFLCPNRDGVAEYLTADYVAAARQPYVDGVHLDYVRFPDVILPVSLWSKYNIEQTRELPEYDYCYCQVCRDTFKRQTGQDPLTLSYPMEHQSWLNFRYDAITRVVDKITRAVKADGKYISGAVFPGPSMARRMVRQDWGNWSLDAYFPMIYNGFYYEGTQWIGRSVRESVTTVNGRAQIFAGLMYPDIKDHFEQALDEAFDNGASGVSFFDGPDADGLRKLKDYLDRRGFKY